MDGRIEGTFAPKIEPTVCDTFNYPHSTCSSSYNRGKIRLSIFFFSLFLSSFTSRQSIGYSRDSNCTSQHANARRSIVMLEITESLLYNISRKYVIHVCVLLVIHTGFRLPRYIRSLFPPLSINRLIHGR